MQFPSVVPQNKTVSLFALSSKSITLLILFLFFSIPCLAQDKKVLLIGIDGLLPEAVGLPETPHMNSLFEGQSGFLTYGYTEDLTFSGPSWSSILHGVHRDRHGVETNKYHGHDFSDYPNFMKRLKDHNPELYTAVYVTWSLLQNNFSKPDGSPDGVDKLVFHSRKENGDQKVTEDLIELLNTGDPDAVFYYQNDIDKAGHGYGFSIDMPEYREQLQKTDSNIGQVLEALEAREGVRSGDEEWLIMLTADHGGVGTGHSGNLYKQRLIPIIVSRSLYSKEGAVSPDCCRDRRLVRPRNVDISKTVLSFMGVPEEEQADLDGHDMLGLDTMTRPEIDYGMNLIVNGDAEYDRGFTDPGIDQVISGWRDQEHTGDKDGYHSMAVVKVPPEVRYIGPDGKMSESQSSNLFAGGSKGVSGKITQHVDVSSVQKDIDNRKVAFKFSGYLNDIGRTGDRMEVTAYFRNREMDVIRTAILKADSKKEHDGEKILRYQERKGIVPPNTDSILFEVHAIGTSGNGVKAYTDNLSFVLNYNQQTSKI